MHGEPGSAVHHDEVWAAATSIIRGYARLRGTDGRDYQILGHDSDVTYVWDEGRQILVDERRTNFWDDQPPTTETILGRPLRSWALPDGMWRPFDLHPDAFSEFDHGCAVQMLYKSFTKVPSGAMKRKGISDKLPVLTVEQMADELDERFEELGYKDGEHSFEHGWRDDGVPATMIVAFCNRQSAKGTPLRCLVFHRGHKIFEFVPENAKETSPICMFAIHGAHAYFYAGGKNAAAFKAIQETSQNKVYDEYTDKRVREPFPQVECPPFSVWRPDHELFANMSDGFAGMAEAIEEAAAAKSKRRRLNEAESKRGNEVAHYYHTTGDLEYAV